MKCDVNNPIFIDGVKAGIKWAKHRLEGGRDLREAEAGHTLLEQLKHEIEHDTATDDINSLEDLLKEADDEIERTILNEL